MSRKKLRIHNTDADHLLSNLRGEVGEAITTWLLMRRIMVAARSLRTDNIGADLRNQELTSLNLLSSKLSDELVGRLSELAEERVGRLSFFFASEKLGVHREEVKRFATFIEKNRIRAKRNCDISHKEMPESWAEHRFIHIDYRVILAAVGMALRLMKKLDRVHLGPSAPFLWRKMRAQRYDLTHPAGAAYSTMPYIGLSQHERVQIVGLEDREGIVDWAEMETNLDGKPTTVIASKKWGVVVVGRTVLALEHYPLRRLDSISSEPARPDSLGSTEATD